MSQQPTFRLDAGFKEQQVSFQLNQASAAVESSAASDVNPRMLAAWAGRRSESEEQFQALGAEYMVLSNSEDTEETKGARMKPKLSSKVETESKETSQTRPYQKREVINQIHFSNQRQVNRDIANSAQQSPGPIPGQTSGRSAGPGEKNGPSQQVFHEIQDSSREYQTAEFFGRGVHHPSAGQEQTQEQSAQRAQKKGAGMTGTSSDGPEQPYSPSKRDSQHEASISTQHMVSQPIVTQGSQKDGKSKVTTMVARKPSVAQASQFSKNRNDVSAPSVKKASMDHHYQQTLVSGKRSKITHIESRDLGTEPNRDVIELSVGWQLEDKSEQGRPSAQENQSFLAQDGKAAADGTTADTPAQMAAQYTPAGQESAQSLTLGQLHKDRSGNSGTNLSLPQIFARGDGLAQRENSTSRRNLKHYEYRSTDKELVRMRERRFEKKQPFDGMMELTQASTDELRLADKGQYKTLGSTTKRNYGIKSEQTFQDFYDGGNRVLKVLPTQTKQFASLSHQVALSVQHRTLAKKNKRNLEAAASQLMSFRTLGQSGPQERLVLPNASSTVQSTTLAQRTRSQKDRMLDHLRSQQNRYQLAENSQQFNFRNDNNTELPSLGSHSQDTKHFRSQLQSQVKTAKIPLVKKDRDHRKHKKQSLNQYNSESRGPLGLNRHGDGAVRTQAHQDSLYQTSQNSSEDGQAGAGKSKSPRVERGKRVQDSIHTTGGLGAGGEVMLPDHLFESSLDTKHNLSAQAVETSIMKSMATPLPPNPFMGELERKKIDKAVKLLDSKEMLLTLHSLEAALESKVKQGGIQVVPALEYYSAIQHALFQVFLDQRLTNRDDSTSRAAMPAGSQSTTNKDGLNLSTQALYSKPFLSFIDQICQGMSITKQYLQRNIQLQFSLKDQIIKEQREHTEKLKGELAAAQAKLLDEDLILSEDRRQEIHREVKEFLESKAIGERIKKEKQDLTGATSSDVASDEEKDLQTLLHENTYSGVLSDLEAVIKLSGGDGAGRGPGMSVFDRALLELEPRSFHEELERHVFKKAKMVQADTAKRVLGKFYRRYDSAAIETQTEFQEDEYRKELESSVHSLKKKLEKISNEYYGERDSNALLVKRQEELIKEIESMLREGREAHDQMELLRMEVVQADLRTRTHAEHAAELENRQKILLERERMLKEKLSALEGEVMEHKDEKEENEISLLEAQEAVEAAKGRAEILQEQIDQLEGQLWETQDKYDAEVEYRETKEEEVSNLLSKVQNLEDTRGKLTEAAKEQEAKHKTMVARYESTVSNSQQPQPTNIRNEAKSSDKHPSKEMAQPLPLLNGGNVSAINHTLKEVQRDETSSAARGNAAPSKVLKPVAPGVPRRTVPLGSPTAGALLGTGPSASSGAVSGGYLNQSQKKTSAEKEEEAKKQVVEEKEKKERAAAAARKAQEEGADPERSRVEEIYRREREEREQQEEIRQLLEQKPSGSTLRPGDTYIRNGRPDPHGSYAPSVAGLDASSSLRLIRRPLRQQAALPLTLEANVHSFTITLDSQMLEAALVHGVRDRMRDAIIEKAMPTDLEGKYGREHEERYGQHLLEQSKKNLIQTEKQLLDLIAQRRSKIGYISTPGGLKFNQSCQTQIDNERLQYILTLAGGRLKAGLSTSTSTQCDRYAGDLNYLYKQYGRHIFDFGQTVDEGKIQKSYQLLALEEKNKHMFYGTSEKQSPLRNQKLRGNSKAKRGRQRDAGTGMQGSDEGSRYRTKEGSASPSRQLRLQSLSPAGRLQAPGGQRQVSETRVSRNADLYMLPLVDQEQHGLLRGAQSNAGGLGAHFHTMDAASLSTSPQQRGSRDRAEATRFAESVLDAHTSGPHHAPSPRTKALGLPLINNTHTTSFPSLQNRSSQVQLSDEATEPMGARLQTSVNAGTRPEASVSAEHLAQLMSVSKAQDAYLKTIESLNVTAVKATRVTGI